MILLNPTYASLRPALMHPEQLIDRGTPIHRGRNELYVTEVEGIRLCIKRYGIPNLFRRFVYRYLRSPKGLRAWRNSLTLREAGFGSPEPVAYIQNESLAGIGACYYICLYADGETLYRWGDRQAEEISGELERFARFAAKLHEAGLMMSDFTPGNILQTEEGFLLVDTNRMRKGRVSVERGLRTMSGLWMQPQTATLLARFYVQARGVSPTEPYEALFAKYRRRFWRRFVRRHGLQDKIVHRDLDGSEFIYHFNSTVQ